MQAYEHLVRSIRDHAIALSGADADYMPLLDMIGDARFVLIGGATYGTDEFYRFRAELTKQLILYGGFSAVMVKADWLDAYRVNRYVHGDQDIGSAASALAGFTRFPAWMWRNQPMVEFIDWLREHNQKKIQASKKVGFYGLDLDNLNASSKDVIVCLGKADPPAAVRARHRAETLETVAAHLSSQRNEPAKIVVWGHNADIGDARATEMGAFGACSIGQLVRERHGRDAVLIGFSTHSGTVTAASAWGGSAEHMSIVPGAPDSYEALFHDTGLKDFMLIPRDNPELAKVLSPCRLQRAIGAVYSPETERQSHYFFFRLPEQFDAIIHLDQTQAIKVLELDPAERNSTVMTPP